MAQELLGLSYSFPKTLTPSGSPERTGAVWQGGPRRLAAAGGPGPRGGVEGQEHASPCRLWGWT